MKTKYIIGLSEPHKNIYSTNDFIRGPSHIHRNYIKQIDEEIKNGLLFDNCVLDSYRGIHIWSHHIYNSINQNYVDTQVYWIVPDYKFNNRDYDKILQMQNTGELFIDTRGLSEPHKNICLTNNFIRSHPNKSGYVLLNDMINSVYI